MKWLLLLGLTLSCGQVRALELLCSGHVYIDDRTGEFSFVFLMEDDTAKAQVWTPKGDAFGVLDSTVKSYGGNVYTGSGETYSISLDRYSGDILVVQVVPPPAERKPSFWGTCRRAERMF